MNSSLLGFVLSNLRRRDRPWTKVAKATGVPYDTLKKIANGVTPNPGVNHVQALADYFAAREADSCPGVDLACIYGTAITQGVPDPKPTEAHAEQGA